MPAHSTFCRMSDHQNPIRFHRVRRLLDWMAPPVGTPLQAWRHRILAAVLLVMVVLGLIAYVPTVWLAVREGEQLVVLIDTVFFLVLFGLLLGRGLSYVARAWTLTALPLVLGTYFLAGFGFEAAGFLWVMAFLIIGAVLLGLRSGVTCLVITSLTLVTLGVFVEQGAFTWAENFPNATVMWAVNSISLLMLASLTTLSIAVLSNGLGNEATRRFAAEDRSAQLAAAVEQSDGLVALLDINANVTYANRAARELAMEGMRIPELAQWPALLNGESWSGSVQFTRPDGEPMVLAGTMSPVRNESGQITHVLSALRDVSRERALEVRLQQGQKLEAIGTLAGGIAHDFNNMLQPIVLNTESVQEQLTPDHEAQPMLRDIRQSAERARALVRRILTFTKGLEHERTAIDLVELVAETERLLRATLPNVIDISFTPPETPVVVLAEAGELQQVLLNLATNAAHAMPNGGSLRLHVAAVRPAGHSVLEGAFPGVERVAELTVSDSGTGMNPDVIARAFEPFFTTKGPGRGTGLGLAMVHGTVTALKGVVVPQSTVGEGTSMRVYLPLANSLPLTPHQTPAETRGHEDRRVMVVDDEPAVLMATTRLLERLGWRVVGFTEPLVAAEYLGSTTCGRLPAHRFVHAGNVGNRTGATRAGNAARTADCPDHRFSRT